MNFLKSWKENVTLLLACTALLFWFVVQNIDHPSARGIPHQAATMILLTVSAFFSARAVVDLASQYQPAVGWWLRGTLRWTFWWILHTLVAIVVTGAIASALPVIPGEIAAIVAAGVATLLLIRQALRDYRAARHRFGSLARAERAARSGSHNRRRL